MCSRPTLPAVVLCLLVPAALSAAPITDVRTLYLIPSDATYNPTYETGIVSALLDLQQWYGDQLGGQTFVLHDPIVEPLATPNPSAYYSTNPNGPFELWFWLNVISDAFTLGDAQFNDPDHAWLFYIDAEPAPGQIGGAGTSGVAVLPQHDLRGLIGLEPEPVTRWIGGLGHELGHAFGLPHPPGCPGPLCPDDTLMWLGYITYPNTYLLPEDKAHLLDSPFVTQIPEPVTLFLLGTGVAAFLARRRRYS